MSQPQITVVGSYATGLTMKVDRLPGKGETLLGTGYRMDYGGKGSNQAVGCARLGAGVRLVAKIGRDAFGEMALDLYRREGIETGCVFQTADAPTGVGFITVEAGSGHNCIVLEPGANELLSAQDVRQAVLKFSAVMLTQLEIPVEAAESALSQGRTSGAITILNPAPVRPLSSAVFNMVDILTPNEAEAKVLAGEPPNSSIEPVAVARVLIDKGVKQVVMTLGESGAVLVTSTFSRHFPAISVRAVDTTGAGDAFNAGLATALAAGTSLEEAISFAIVIGGMAVTREGVIPSLPRIEEVVAFHRELGLTPPAWLVTDRVASR